MFFEAWRLEMNTEALASNGVRMTPGQHEKVHSTAGPGSGGSFIVRLESFLAEMDRRNREQKAVTVSGVGQDTCVKEEALHA